jgi:asparagine synthetase A
MSAHGRDSLLRQLNHAKLRPWDWEKVLKEFTHRKKHTAKSINPAVWGGVDITEMLVL